MKAAMWTRRFFETEMGSTILRKNLKSIMMFSLFNWRHPRGLQVNIPKGIPVPHTKKEKKNGKLAAYQRHPSNVCGGANNRYPCHYSGPQAVAKNICSSNDVRERQQQQATGIQLCRRWESRDTTLGSPISAQKSCQVYGATSLCNPGSLKAYGISLWPFAATHLPPKSGKPWTSREP